MVDKMLVLVIMSRKLLLLVVVSNLRVSLSEPLTLIVLLELLLLDLLLLHLFGDLNSLRLIRLRLFYARLLLLTVRLTGLGRRGTHEGILLVRRKLSRVHGGCYRLEGLRSDTRKGRGLSLLLFLKGLSDSGRS